MPANFALPTVIFELAPGEQHSLKTAVIARVLAGLVVLARWYADSI